MTFDIERERNDPYHLPFHVTARRRELEYMLHLGRKAEIQVLSSCHGSRGDSPLVRYLVRELNAACTECQGTGEGEV